MIQIKINIKKNIEVIDDVEEEVIEINKKVKMG